MRPTLRKLGFVVAAGSLLLAAGLAFSSGASANGATVGVSSMNSSVGGVGKVNLTVADIGVPGAGAWTIDVHFDPLVVSGVACTAEQGGSICNAQFDAGAVRVVGTNVYGLQGNAVLASIGLACKSAGESALEIATDVFVDATPGDPTDIVAKISNGTATCSAEPPPTATEPKSTATPPASNPKVPGDANCDGLVNSLDAALVLQYDAGLIHSLTCADADYNHDGVVNSLDAALILQKDAGLIH
jgi:hypothetical protein